MIFPDHHIIYFTIFLALKVIFAHQCHWHLLGSSIVLDIGAGVEWENPLNRGQILGCGTNTFGDQGTVCLLIKGGGSFVGSVDWQGNVECYVHSYPTSTQTGQCIVSVHLQSDRQMKEILIPLNVGETVSGFYDNRPLTIGCFDAAMTGDYMSYRRRRQICRVMPGSSIFPELANDAENEMRTMCKIN